MVQIFRGIFQLFRRSRAEVYTALTIDQSPPRERAGGGEREGSLTVNRELELKELADVVVYAAAPHDGPHD